MDEEVAAALLRVARFFPCPPVPPLPHPSALAGPLERAPVAVPASAAGRAATLPRGGAGRADGPFWLVMLATAAPPLKPRAPSVPRGCRGAYWVGGAVWLAWLPSATVWCVRVCRGGPVTLKRLVAAAGACRARYLSLWRF